MKVKKSSGRGTGTREEEVKDQNWAGDAYRKESSDKLKKISKNVTLSSGRGVGTRKLKDLPEPKPRPSTEGMTRVTGRGTGSRKSQNKGSK